MANVKAHKGYYRKKATLSRF